MMIAHVLARRGHDVYFVTNNTPVFADDLAPISDNNPVRVIVTNNDFDVLPDGRFDAVFVAPQMSFLPRFYKSAVRFAREAHAGLFLINYESPNWFNALSPVKRSEHKWREWLYIAKEGACIVSSARESDKFARDFYTDLPLEADFTVWQPAINTVACDASQDQRREKLIILFSRPSDRHKGGGDIKDLIGPELHGYKVGIVIGNPQQSESFLHDLRLHGEKHGVGIEPFFNITDRQKFALLKRASAIVFPSYFEGYGYPPMEALAADVPCVAYDLPVLRENCGDRIRYAPVGNVTALREQLVEALRSPAAKTSKDPHVRALTNVDDRGAALEHVIQAYLAKISGRSINSREIQDGFRLSAASTIKVSGRTHVTFTAALRERLTGAAVASGKVKSVQYFSRGWSPEGWRYCFFLSMVPGAGVQELADASISLQVQGASIGMELSLSGVRISKGRVPWLSPKTYRLKKIARSGHRALLSGWAFPQQAYDGLYLMDEDGAVISLNTALKDDGYKGLFAAGANNYGFMSDTVDMAGFRVGAMRLIALREDRIIGKGRVNATAMMASATPLTFLGADQKNSVEMPDQSTSNRPQSEHNFGAAFVKLKGHALTSLSPTIASPLIRRGSLVASIQSTAERNLPRVVRGFSRTGAIAHKPDLDLNRVKWALSEASYIEDTGEINVKGWVSTPDNTRIEVWGGDMNLLGIAQVGYPRPDVARELKNKSRDDFGFVFSVPFEGDLEDGIMIRLFHDGRLLAQKLVRNLLVKPSQGLRVDDCLFDSKWNMLWMRGTFKTAGAELEGLEVLQGTNVLAEAAIEERLQAATGRSFRWRVESIVAAPVQPGERLTLRVRLNDSPPSKISYVVPNREHWEQGIAVPDGHFHYSVTGNGIHTVLSGARVAPGTGQTILLLVHNLNAPERGEKRRALEAVRRELNSNGVELILLHHSKSPSGCNIPEINFFDPRLEILCNAETDAAELIDPETLNYAQRMLYGFTFALNRRPKSWDDIQTQTTDELRKVATVTRLLQPSMLLLWHQWNSLMILGKAVADTRSLPVAIVHEGMLPGTMTIDSRGMMAESESLGAFLDADDGNNSPFLDHARYAIGEIRTKNLDRKPHAGTPGALQIVRNLKEKGVKTVFYAGVNDWQSGNLPADHERAKLHSPFFKDTLEGLEALLKTADRHDFVVLYKPHPNLFPRPLEMQHDRLVYVREANSTECLQLVDAVATLFSSLAYISLAHGVPTVLMGRNTLSNVHAAYELGSYPDLDACLADALAATDLGQRLTRYESHVAALLKNDLFPYGEKTDFSMLTYKDAAERITDIMNRLCGPTAASPQWDHAVAYLQKASSS
ncbi:glycosyltransferase (plasmid) [Sinorhizobium fredii]|nr:glycosyltransferase [Sinorhizobium fredii]